MIYYKVCSCNLLKDVEDVRAQKLLTFRFFSIFECSWPMISLRQKVKIGGGGGGVTEVVFEIKRITDHRPLFINALVI